MWSVLLCPFSVEQQKEEESSVAGVDGFQKGLSNLWIGDALKHHQSRYSRAM